MVDCVWVSEGKSYQTSADVDNDSGSKTLQWMIYFAMRPGGMDGTAGRAKSLNEVLSMTIPQIVFLCYERKHKMQDDDNGHRTIEEVKQRYSTDEWYREEYAAKVKREIQKAKDRLNGKAPPS